MNKKVGKILTAAAAGAVVGVAVKKLQDGRKEKEDERIAAIEEAVMNNRDYGEKRAYLVGGGLATMAAAAYLIRDCKFPGDRITIYEGMHILGGSNDGIGDPEHGFVCRGGRMLNEETYENFWELFSSIPSIRQPGRSVTEEILNFDHAHPTCAKARLVDRDGKIQDVKSMGFNQADRNALLKLLLTDEKKLDNLTIQDWFKETPHMFETNFWYMWQTTFAFQKWSSLYEFRRYMNRMIFEFSRIETLEGVTRTPLNQYDSVIRPLESYLRKAGVSFMENCEVTDIDFEDGHGITARTLYLKRKVETSVRDEINQFLEDNDISSGVRLIEDYKRYYPYGTVASTVLGFTGTDGQGLDGVELQYDTELRGTSGRLISSRNALGTDMPFEYEQYVEAQDGNNLVLTIDETVQSVLEKYLAEGVDQFNVKNGAVAIMMDVDTGAILGLATTPSYDPNDPFTIYDENLQAQIDALPEDEQDAAFNEAQLKQWRNKAVSDTYYPGSVFKMCTYAMGLEEGVVTEQTTYTCTGGITVEGWPYPINCWRTTGHGLETFRDGLCNSCNPYTIYIGQLLGGETFAKYREAFGFTESTGIDLPGEAVTLFHSVTDLINTPSDLAVESFGQNFSITPLHMITAAAAIANGGNLVTPHVMDRIVDQDGNIVETADTSTRRQVISQETCDAIIDILQQNAESGSASGGYVAGYRVCGKTGTSEKVDKWNEDRTQDMEYIASYCGFAPAEDPKYALLVFFDEPDDDTNGGYNGGNAVAGPYFAKMMESCSPTWA
mgnify:CR=1 FL=1